MDYPSPEIGLVITYSYLWKNEAAAGHSGGRKNRPCAILLSVQQALGGPTVTVAPITHSKPRDPNVAVEIPAAVSRNLGLDDDKGWVVLDEVNQFTWPGYDLRVNPKTGQYEYGFLPPLFYGKLVTKFHQLEATLTTTPRD